MNNLSSIIKTQEDEIKSLKLKLKESENTYQKIKKLYDSLKDTSEEGIKSLNINLKLVNEEYNQILKNNNKLLKKLNDSKTAFENLSKEYNK